MQQNVHHHGAQHQAPPMQTYLKRQASQLRTQYPDTCWCAVYIDSSSQASSNQQNDYINENELLEPIPKTNVCVFLYLYHLVCNK